MSERTMDRALAWCGVVVAALALTACGDSEKSHRGIDYMPDMYESPAYRSYQAQVVTVGEGKDAVVHHVPAMLTPPEGTVARGVQVYALGPNDWAEAKQLTNPLAPTAQVLREGQANFNVYCAVCHGNDGNAVNGYVAKHFSGIMSVNTVNVATMPDGEVFHIIGHGRGRMPNYRAQLLPEARWAVVHYVKALARASIVTGEAEAALTAAKTALEQRPKDDLLKADVEKAQRAIDTAVLDREQILRGDSDAAEFAPHPAPVPEYVKPQWPEH